VVLFFGAIGLVFSTFELKLLVMLVLVRVCILALSSFIKGSFYYMFFIPSSNDRWSFFSSCQFAKLLFLWGPFSLNTTFFGNWLWVGESTIKCTIKNTC
jgi:hypothetical protein